MPLLTSTATQRSTSGSERASTLRHSSYCGSDPVLVKDSYRSAPLCRSDQRVKESGTVKLSDDRGRHALITVSRKGSGRQDSIDHQYRPGRNLDGARPAVASTLLASANWIIARKRGLSRGSAEAEPDGQLRLESRNGRDPILVGGMLSHPGFRPAQWRATARYILPAHSSGRREPDQGVPREGVSGEDGI